MTAYLSISGQRARSGWVFVPYTGPWVAEVLFDQTITPPAGKVTLLVGGLSLVGTVDPTQTGTYGLATKVTLVGGAGGWSKVIAPKPYHNDATIKASRIALDAAALAGETLTIDPTLDGQIGVDYLRFAGAASRVIEVLFPSSAWWVAPDGSTRVAAARPSSDVSGNVQLLEADPARGRCDLYADDLTNVLPGGSITDVRLPAGFQIHDVEIVVSDSSVVAHAWSGSQRDSRLVSHFAKLVDRSLPRIKYASGPYRYRVVSMATNRVNLQAVASKQLGIPDALPVSLAPGMAGLSAQLTPGAIVLVEFIESNPAMPVITHFAAPDDPAFLPVSVSLDASGHVDIGKSAPVVHVGVAQPYDPLLAPGKFIRHGDTVQIGSTTGVIQITGGQMSTAGT